MSTTAQHGGLELDFHVPTLQLRQLCDSICLCFILICCYWYVFVFIHIIITPPSAPAALKNVMLVQYKCCVSFILVLGLQLCWYWTCDYQQLWLNMSRWHTDGSCHHETLLRRLQALQNIDQYENQNWLQDEWYFVDIVTLFYLIFPSFVLVSFFVLWWRFWGGLWKETHQ